MSGQVVDTESAQEFMREALAKITEVELESIAGELEQKHAGFAGRLTKEALSSATPDDLRPVLRSVFSTRRRVDTLLEDPIGARLASWISELLYGGGPIEQRFQSFCDHLEQAPESVRYDLAGELLHYTDPERYWLWTRWLWDPRTRTGSLALVTMPEFELAGTTVGETYMRVGQATAFVQETGRAAGFARIGQGRLGLNVYLACVYGVYVYTTVRMRMTQEFNRVIPPLPELCRRFLGVYGMEV